MKSGEFALIEKIKKVFATGDSGSQSASAGADGVVGIGDDCAVMPQKTGFSTIVSTDMLVEGSHFILGEITPYQLGWKSAAVNISDIAAMGGEPTGLFLSVALPDSVDDEWVSEFIRGLGDVALPCHAKLLGGDTTRSKGLLCINVAVTGQVRLGAEIRRNGAQAGDLICVTGCLGDSAAGLRILQGGCPENDTNVRSLVERHFCPRPCVAEGLALTRANELRPGSVTAMMDISDGIGSDLQHITHQSGVNAVVDTDALPLSDELKAVFADKTEQKALAIDGGEDYQLLFTVNPEALPLVRELLHSNLTVIGEITTLSEGARSDGAGPEGGTRLAEGAGPEGAEGAGRITWLGSDTPHTGYRHF